MPKNKRSKVNQNNHQQKHFELKTIRPLTDNQHRVFKEYDAGFNLMLHGFAGTGKSYISLYLALDQILRDNTNTMQKIVIIRSVVPSRDIGFLPGSIKDKSRIYEEPYREICDNLFDRGDGYDILKMKGIVEFTTTSFLRGTTFNNSIVVVDECQNLNKFEVDTIITRVGQNSRIIICGDTHQTDLHSEKEKEGMSFLMNITKKMPSFRNINFTMEEIVRSGLVKEYIIAKHSSNS